MSLYNGARPVHYFGTPKNITPGCRLWTESTRRQREQKSQFDVNDRVNRCDDLTIDMETDQLCRLPLTPITWMPRLLQKLQAARTAYPVKHLVVNKCGDITELYTNLFNRLLLELPPSNIETIEIRGTVDGYLNTTQFATFISGCTSLKVLHIHRPVASQDSIVDLRCYELPWELHWHLNLRPVLRNNVTLQDLWLRLEYYGSEELAKLLNDITSPETLVNLHLEIRYLQAAKMYSTLSDILAGFASYGLKSLERFTLVLPSHQYSENKRQNIVGEEHGFVGEIVATFRRLKEFKILTTEKTENLQQNGPMLNESFKQLIEKTLVLRSTEFCNVDVRFFSVRTKACDTYPMLAALQSPKRIVVWNDCKTLGVYSRGVNLYFDVAGMEFCRPARPGRSECKACYSWYPAVLSKIRAFGRNTEPTDFTVELSCGLPECRVKAVDTDINQVGEPHCQGVVDKEKDGRAGGSVTFLYKYRLSNDFKARVFEHRCVIPVVQCNLHTRCMFCREQEMCSLD